MTVIGHGSLSRRRFLAATALAGAGALLAACSAAPPTPTAAPKAAEPTSAAKPAAATPTAAAKPAGKGAVEANLIAAKWVIDEWGLPNWIDEYNKLGSAKVNLEQVPDGYEAKVLAMIRAGDVQWDGVGVMSTIDHKVKYVESGMIQPLEPYISGSNVDGARGLLEDIIPTVKQDISYKGKVYGIPYSFEAIGLMWYTEPLAAVGYKDVPATWDDTLDAARKVNKEFKAQQVTPIAWNPGIHTSVHGLLHTATTKPYTEDGLVDITGEAGIKVVKFLQTLFKEGVTPPHGSDGWRDLWERAKLSLLFAQNSRGTWAQRIHGAEKVGTGKLPLPAKGAANSGSPFWTNTLAVWEKAKQPQAFVDFVIWMLNAKNTPVHKAIIESGKAPALTSLYPGLVDPNPVFKWMAGHRDMVAQSIPIPENPFWPLQNQKIMPWLNQLMEKDTKLTPEEAMANALKDVKEEVAKQKVK